MKMLVSLVMIIPFFSPTLSVGGNSDENDSVKKTTSRVVHTKYGSVSGTIEHLDGRHLDPVEAFRGIPYASPPVGTLRFMPPVTGALWSGVKKADRYKNDITIRVNMPSLTARDALNVSIPTDTARSVHNVFQILPMKLRLWRECLVVD